MNISSCNIKETESIIVALENYLLSNKQNRTIENVSAVIVNIVNFTDMLAWYPNDLANDSNELIDSKKMFESGMFAKFNLNGKSIDVYVSKAIQCGMFLIV